MSQKFSLSVIIPIFNEEYHINKFFYKINDQLKKLKFLDYEIIFIDDGSVDNSFSKLVTLSNFNKKYVKVYRNLKNIGIGFAIKRGIRMSKKKNILWTGLDCDVPLSDYLLHYKKLKRYQLLIFYLNKKNNREPIRKLFSNSYTALLNFIFGYNLPYYNGLFLMNKSCMKKIDYMSNRFFFSAEIKLLSLKKNFKYLKIPVKMNQNLRSNTKTIFKVKNWLDIFRFIIYYKLKL